MTDPTDPPAPVDPGTHHDPQTGGRTLPEVAREWMTTHPTISRLTLGPEDAGRLMEIYEDFLSRNDRPPLPSGTSPGRVAGIITRSPRSRTGYALHCHPTGRRPPLPHHQAPRPPASGLTSPPPPRPNLRRGRCAVTAAAWPMPTSARAGKAYIWSYGHVFISAISHIFRCTYGHMMISAYSHLSMGWSWSGRDSHGHPRAASCGARHLVGGAAVISFPRLLRTAAVADHSPSGSPSQSTRAALLLSMMPFGALKSLETSPMGVCAGAIDEGRAMELIRRHLRPAGGLSLIHI